MKKTTKQEPQKQSNLTFIRPSRVLLSKDKKWLLIFIGNAVVSIHQNYAKAIFANKGKKRAA